MGKVVMIGEEGVMEREKKAEMIIETEEEDTGNRVDASVSMMRCERFVPRMVLRVLLVEADDSTRHIIAALLRKCSYKVAAVADGLKAWELLKGRPKNVDLILTEIELPSISGFALLSLITEHEICKRIPVIMMSSQDSVTMVYKCMLRGSSDFLVKPVRKNELKNLWQHVWRRQKMSIGIERNPLDESVTQQKVEVAAENDDATNASSGFIASIQRNRELTEKGSDAQSSCRKPEMKGDGHACVDEPPLKSLMPKKKSQNETGHEEAALKKDGEMDDRSLNGVPNLKRSLNASSNRGDRNCLSNSSAKKVELDLSLGNRSSYPYENQMLKQSAVSAFSRYVSSKTLEPSSQSIVANNQSPSLPDNHEAGDEFEKQPSNHFQDCHNNTSRPQQLRYLSIPGNNSMLQNLCSVYSNHDPSFLMQQSYINGQEFSLLMNQQHPSRSLGSHSHREKQPLSIWTWFWFWFWAKIRTKRRYAMKLEENWQKPVLD